MTHRDEMERVLAALAEVKAPAELERRVLRQLEERVVVRSAWWRSGWMSALAGGAFVTMLGLGVWELRERSANGSSVAGSTAMAPLSSSSSDPQLVLHPSARIAEDLGAALPVGVHKVARVPDRRPLEQPAEFAQHGFPAPEAPLSEQERLLLRLARRPNQGTIAIFDPRLREERAAIEGAEFEFFNPQQPIKTDEVEETQSERTPGKQ